MDEFKGRIETFAERLKRAMEIRGLKKAELSRQTGISEQRIGQYVRGNYETRQSAIYLIAKALHVSPAWLAGYDVSMEPAVDRKSKKGGRAVSDEDLKLAVFGTKEVNDELLADILDMAKIHLEFWKKRHVTPPTHKNGRRPKTGD